MTGRFTRRFKHFIARAVHPAILPMSKADERDLRLLNERRRRAQLDTQQKEPRS